MKVLLLLILSITSILPTWGAQINPLFIHGNKHYDAASLSAFINGNDFPPGKYILPIFVNGEYRNKASITVKKNGEICKDISLLDFYLNNKKIKGDDCGEFDKKTKSVFKLDKENNIATYQVKEQYIKHQLNWKSLKQSIQKNHVNSLYTNYNATTTHTNNDQNSIDQQYGDFSIRGNISDIRLVSNFNYNAQKIKSTDFYIAKPLYEYGLEAKAGEFSATIDPFSSESIYMQGVSLSTDSDLYLTKNKHYPYTGYVSEPSSILIYKNNRLLKRFFIQAGNYTLDDSLAGSDISGDITIVELGVSGTTNRKRVYLPRLNDLLSLNQKSLGLSYGLLNPNALKKNNIHLFSASYRQGFQYLTPFASLNYGDTGYSRISSGASMILFDDNQIGFSLAKSSYLDQSGSSAGLSFQSNFKGSPFSIALSAFHTLQDGYLSVSNYASLSSQSRTSTQKSQTSANITYRTPWRGLSNIYITWNQSHAGNSFTRAPGNKVSRFRNHDFSGTNNYLAGLTGKLPIFRRSATWSLTASLDDLNNNITTLSVNIPLDKQTHSATALTSVDFSIAKNSSGKNYSAYTTVNGGNNAINYYAKVSSDNGTNYEVGASAPILHAAQVTGSVGNNFYSASVSGSAALTTKTGLTLQTQQLTNPVLIRAKGLEGTLQSGTLINSEGYGIAEASSSGYNQALWKLNTRDADINTVILSDSVSQPLGKGVMTKVFFKTLQRQTYHAILHSHGKPLPLGSIVTINKKTFYTQTAGELLFYIEKGQKKINLSISKKVNCKININEKLINNHDNRRIPDLGVLNCE